MQSDFELKMNPKVKEILSPQCNHLGDEDYFSCLICMSFWEAYKILGL